MSYRTLGFPEYGVNNASNCKCDFTKHSSLLKLGSLLQALSYGSVS